MTLRQRLRWYLVLGLAGSGLVLFNRAMPLFAQGDDRVAAARPRAEKLLREKFTAAGLTYPAHEVFFRAFKREGVLEIWARNKPGQKFTLVHPYTVAYASGGPGPKRKEGDRQVPEGFYTIDRFNPKSSFHLSLGLNYPNAADRVHSDQARPGGDIFIHGSDVSIGCLAMTDPIIEEIYLMALDSKARPIRVHVFPARMNAVDWVTWRDEQTKTAPHLTAHWDQLLPGFEHFERDRLIPSVQIDKGGLYRCQPAK